MTKKTLVKNWPAFAAALTLAGLAHSPVCAQSTAFTYQGQLDDAGAPTNDLHDFRFRLFDAATGGAALGSTLCADNVDVIEGVFTAQLDFGQQFATTAQRYLEIEVRRDTGLTCADATGFVVLAPRQQLTAAPMASHANSAFALDAADGSPASAVLVDNSGNVGIGTTSPLGRLHVNGSLFWGGDAVDHGYSGEDESGMFLEQYGTTAAKSRIRLQTSKSGDVTNYSQFFIDPLAGFSFVDVGSANSSVGIGTTTPLAKLDVRGDVDVRGDIQMGPTAQLYATSGEENLRIVRGRVSSSGTVLMGSGFTASRTTTGQYIICFSPTFPAGQGPAMTVSAEWTSGAHVAMTNGVLSTCAGVRVMTGGGTPADLSFYFTAIGPR